MNKPKKPNGQSGKPKIVNGSESTNRKRSHSTRSGWVMYGEGSDGSLVALLVTGAVVITPSVGKSDGCVVTLEYRPMRAWLSKRSTMRSVKGRHGIRPSDGLQRLQTSLSQQQWKFTVVQRPLGAHS